MFQFCRGALGARRLFITCLALSCLGLGAAFASGVCDDPDALVEIPDENLYKIIVEATPDMYVPTCRTLRSLWTLEIRGTERNSPDRVRSLAGIENAVNLVSLTIVNADLDDLAPLAGLTNLKSLTLYWAGSASLAPVAELSALEVLRIQYMRDVDLSPLEGLGALRTLWIGVSDVHDIRPLAGLTQLDTLWLFTVSVNDLSPLAGLTRLRQLLLNESGVTDLAPLSGLKELRYLSIANTGVSDIAPLAGLTSLEYLDMELSFVRDLGPLVDNPGFGAGDKLHFWATCVDMSAGSPNAAHAETLARRGVLIESSAEGAAPVEKCQ